MPFKVEPDSGRKQDLNNQLFKKSMLSQSQSKVSKSPLCVVEREQLQNEVDVILVKLDRKVEESATFQLITSGSKEYVEEAVVIKDRPH